MSFFSGGANTKTFDFDCQVTRKKPKAGAYRCFKLKDATSIHIYNFGNPDRRRWTLQTYSLAFVLY